MIRIAWSSFVMDGGCSGIASYIRHTLNALSHLDQTNYYDIWLPKNMGEQLPSLGAHFQRVLSPNILDAPLLNIMWQNLVFPWHAYHRGYDLVHIPSIRRIPFIKPPGAKLIATVHDLGAFVIRDKYSRSRMFYHHKILKRLVHRCDQIIVPSHATANDLSRFTGYPKERTHVIYLGIDHHLFRPQPKAASAAHLSRRYGFNIPFFVYISRLEHPGKNHVALIKAFEIFRDRGVGPHHLVFAGPDWSGSQAVKQRVQESPYAQDIHVLGRIPSQDIVALYSATTALVFPSLFEGFGFPLLEAMACGALVISSNRASLGELAEGYALLADPTSSRELSDRMVEVTEYSESKRMELTQLGIKYASQFFWESSARKLLNVYGAI